MEYIYQTIELNDDDALLDACEAMMLTAAINEPPRFDTAERITALETEVVDELFVH